MAFTAFATGTAKEQAPRRKSKIALLLLLPGILYLMLFFLVPLIALLATSLQEPIPFGDFGQYQTAFRWENYIEVISSYGDQIIRSFAYALLATIFALLFSYPVAYFIGVKCRPWPLLQNLLLVLVIAPFFISFLLRTLAWKSILADEGIVITTLKALALMAPDAHFTGTPAAVVFGLTYNFIPFMTLPLYSTLERLDTRLLGPGKRRHRLGGRSRSGQGQHQHGDQQGTHVVSSTTRFGHPSSRSRA